MAEEGKGTALVILGVVAIVAVVGLVLLFSGGKSATGAVGAPSIVGSPDAVADTCSGGTHQVCMFFLQGPNTPEQQPNAICRCVRD